MYRSIPAAARVPSAALPSFIQKQISLTFGPVDGLEHHSTLEHFGLEVSSVLFPIGRLAHAKDGFTMIPFEGIVRSKGAAYALIHHGQAPFQEGGISPPAAPSIKEPPLG